MNCSRVCTANGLSIDDPREVDFYQRLAVAAEQLMAEIYLVGGYVRDRLLGMTGNDIDLMIVPDGVPFIQDLFSRWDEFFTGFEKPVRKVVFRRYGTGKLEFEQPIFRDVLGFDFSTVRSETYPDPAKAPVISAGTLETDILRRDFSVNALMASLKLQSFLQVIDLVDGTRDLQSRLLRVLHSGSFIDDPARILRGVRLSVRLGFSFEPETEKLLRGAIQSRRLQMLPEQRLRDEFRKLLEEPQHKTMLDVLRAYGAGDQLPLPESDYAS